MNRGLLTPKWLALHVLFFVATVSTGFLAWWQWSRAQDAGGSYQNLGYALMWPLFGFFTAYLWYHLCSLELRVIREADKGTRIDETLIPEPESGTESPASQTLADRGTPAGNVGARAESTGTPGGRAGNRRLVPPPAPTPDADDDPELAAYNDYLAELNRVDR